MTGCLKPKRIKRRLALPSKFTSYLFAEKLCSLFTEARKTQWEDPRLQKLGGPVS